MNPTRDEILRMLMVMMLRHPDSQSDIEVLNLLKYDQPFQLTDDLQIPYMGQVKALISDAGGGGGVVYRTFLIPAPITLPLNLTGRTNEQGDTVIPSDAVVSVYEGGKIVPATYYETGLIEGLDGSLDVKVVLVGGEQVVPAGLILVNTTDVNLNYSVNGGSFSTLNVLESINVMQGDNLILALSSASAFYQLWNQNGAIENTDSSYLIEEIPHEWQIPLDSTELNIIGVE